MFDAINLGLTLPPPPFLLWVPTFLSYTCLLSCFKVLVLINPPALTSLITWHQLYNDKMGLGPCYPCNNSGYFYYAFFCFFAACNYKMVIFLNCSEQNFFFKFLTVGRRCNFFNDHLFYVLHDQLTILYPMNLYPRQWGGDIIFSIWKRIYLKRRFSI